MVKRLRQNLIAQGRDKLCEQVSEITGAKILGVFTDIDVQLGERVFVFTMDRDITERRTLTGDGKTRQRIPEIPGRGLWKEERSLYPALPETGTARAVSSPVRIPESIRP